LSFFCCKPCAPCPPPTCYTACAPAPAPAPPPAPVAHPCCVAWYDAGARSWKTEPATYTASQAQTRVAQLKAFGYSAYSRYY
jgi:hypothetical protein